jgi:VanZ family protein
MQDSPPATPAVPSRHRWASRARTLAIVYFAMLCIATHVPSSLQEPVETVSDKWVHFAAYAVLTVCVLAGWELTIGVLQPKHYFAVWLVGTLFGAVDEITQIPVSRTCDVNDWVSDALGVVCGLLAYRLARALFVRDGKTPATQ